MAAVVVPLPPDHVTLKPTWPFLVPGGGVFVVDPVPPFNAAGVHDANVDFAPAAVILPDVTLAQVTCDVSAADAGAANGTNSAAPVASANAIVLTRLEVFINRPPLIGMVLSVHRKLIYERRARLVIMTFSFFEC